jgi:hypothetical protein
MPGVREGHLVELFKQAGMEEVEGVTLSADLEHQTFEEWWEPFIAGVGPAGAYAAGLEPPAQAALRERCRARLGPGPFVIPARAWAARGVSGSAS